MFLFHARRGFSLLRQDRSLLGSLGIVTLLCFLLQLTLLGYLTTSTSEELLESRSRIDVTLKNSVPDSDIQELTILLQNTPEVSSVIYRTKEQAREMARMRDPELIKVFENTTENPFSDTLIVELASRHNTEMLTKLLLQDRWIIHINPRSFHDLTNQWRNTDRLSETVQTLGRFTVIGLVVLVVTLLLIFRRISSELSINYREELLVSKLVGADTTTRITPLVTSVSIIGWCGICISLIALVVLLFLLPLGSLATTALHLKLSMPADFPLFVLGEIVLVPVLSVVAVLWSTEIE